MLKKWLVLLSLLAISTPVFSAYEEVECSTDVVFSENSCNQCFNWGSTDQGEYLELLTDLWMNLTNIKKLLYKEEQVDPEMINLDPTNVSWVQTPSAEGFWEYTDEFNALYSDIEEWYILEPGASVTWIKSALSYAFKLEKNTADKWTNIGMLVYSIYTHNILEDGEITIDNDEHRECVLFKSGENGEDPTPEPKKLPETGPAEYMLLIILAMIIGFGILKFRTRS